ncbi:MAG: hypothetical protein R2861_16460 [Desulfobacterales bacterium]
MVYWPPRKRENCPDFLDISLSTSLDAAGTTEAAKGILEIQERRLAKPLFPGLNSAILKQRTRCLRKPAGNHILIRIKSVKTTSLASPSRITGPGLMENAAGDFSVAFKKFADPQISA